MFEQKHSTPPTHFMENNNNNNNNNNNKHDVGTVDYDSKTYVNTKVYLLFSLIRLAICYTRL